MVFGILTDSSPARDAYLAAENRVSQAFLLVKHLDDCRGFADEIIFYQRVRKQILKTIPGKKTPEEVERAVRDLVDDAVDSTGLVDIFKAAGIDRPDISILDDEFLKTFKDKPHPDLRLKLLEKLIRDELASRLPRNLAKTRDFQEMLEETLRRYHNRLLDAAAVVEAMLRIKKELDATWQRAERLGLSAEELAFYDAIEACSGDLPQQKLLSDLVHDVVAAVKRNVKVDWTRPHRADVQAALRAAVKRTLARHHVSADQLTTLTESVMKQAEALYVDWPMAA